MLPFTLKPTYVSTIWGGDKIMRARNITPTDTVYGESFDISAHPTVETSVNSGPHAGAPLGTLMKTHPEDLLGHALKDDPGILQATFMDARQFLSVQVHPNDDYAQELGDFGKCESWYILDADPDAQLIAGCTTTNKEDLRAAAKDDSIGPRFGKYLPVEAGDFVQVLPGTMHAMGPGILSVEIGSFGNTTLRLCDWGRGREIHTEQALIALDPTLDATITHHGAPLTTSSNSIQPGACNSVFTTQVADIHEPEHLLTKGIYMLVVCVAGSLTLTARDSEQETTITLGYTESCFVPASCTSITLSGHGRAILAQRSL